MTETNRSASAEAPAALSAFLRGIERRGAVFAELHGGDPVLGDQALAIALRMFREHAAEQSFSRWPSLFWRALLATPQLRTGPRNPAWPAGVSALGKVGAGPRAALLLRLVAGLGDASAAEVLGVAPATYRLALRQALPRDGAGQADAAAWRQLTEAVQQRMRDLPAERLAHLARMREAAVQGRRPELIGPLPPPKLPSDAGPSAWVRGLLWAGFICCLGFLLLTFAWPSLFLPAGSPGQVRQQALGPAEAPASRYRPELGVLTEPDFELLAHGETVPPRNDPAFYAWYAVRLAGTSGAEDPDAGMRDPAPSQSQPPASAEPETTDVF